MPESIHLYRSIGEARELCRTGEQREEKSAVGSQLNLQPNDPTCSFCHASCFTIDLDAFLLALKQE